MYKKMLKYKCFEIINTENLDKIIKARRLDASQLTRLKNLQKRLKDQGGFCHEVDFIQNSTDGVGRLWPKLNAPSVQGMKRDVRKALTCDTYTDIDMVNAHPCILSQLFKRLNLDCPRLDEYITNREVLLQGVMEVVDDVVNALPDDSGKFSSIRDEHLRKSPSAKRDHAKSQFLRIMYGGKLKSIKFETSNGLELYVPWAATEFLHKFHEEFKHNSTTLLTFHDYEKFMKLGESKKPYNPVGCGLSLLAQNMEREIISIVIETFQHKFKTGTIMHDGFLVQDLDVPDDILRKAEQEVLHTYTYAIKLSKKSLKDFDEDILWGVKASNDDEIEFESDSHTEIARHFIKYMEAKGHAFTRSEGEVFWFNPDHGIYLTGLRELRVYMNDCSQLPRLCGKTDMQNNLKKQVESLVGDDLDFRNKVVHTTYRKIAFKNGYYDCEKKCLCNYNRDVYFLMKGSIDYVPQEQGIIDEVWDKLFLGVFGTEEVSKYMLKSFARGMAGEIKDKRLFFIVGEPNSGKGTFTEVFKRVFPSQFNTLNSGDFCAKKSDGNSALNNQHLVQGRDKRVAFLNETSRAKGQEWNAQAIKVFSNGGESIMGRLNFDREAKIFINQQTGFCNMNDTPKIQGFQSDVKIRCVAVRTAFSYINPADFDEKTAKPFQKVADEDVKDVFLHRPEILQAFAQLICEGYVPQRPAMPECVKIETDECFDEEDEETKIKNLFEYVKWEGGDKKYRPFVKKDLFVKKLDDIGVQISTNRLSRHMKGWGYPVDDRGRKGERGWYDIKLVVANMEFTQDH
jgi:phage/plasmid-associated DNA primase